MTIWQWRWTPPEDHWTHPHAVGPCFHHGVCEWLHGVAYGGTCGGCEEHLRYVFGILSLGYDYQRTLESQLLGHTSNNLAGNVVARKIHLGDVFFYMELCKLECSQVEGGGTSRHVRRIVLVPTTTAAKLSCFINKKVRGVALLGPS